MAKSEADRKAAVATEKEKTRKRKPLKNGNGQGSVYKLSGRRRKPWAARVTTGWTEDGKQLKQLIGYFEKKSDAEEALLMHRINPVSPKANITFGELYNEWSEAKYKMISKSTADNYRAAWKYLSKYESATFRELRTTHYQSVINDCMKEGKSRSTMEKIKALATSLYGYALQNDIINKNYGEFIVLGKPEKSKKEPFTQLDIKKMFAFVNKIEWVDTILILIYTGMRISELLGLTRFNVDMDQQLITGGVKTDAGKDRVIPIHPKIANLIRKWYDKGGNYLICNDKGGKISVSSYREDKYYPALKQMGLKKLTPHSCRHTFGTLLSKAGANTKAIQDMIGHSDYALTANVYTHTDLDELRREINKI
jgi:integrase